MKKLHRIGRTNIPDGVCWLGTANYQRPYFYLESTPDAAPQQRTKGLVCGTCQGLIQTSSPGGNRQTFGHQYDLKRGFWRMVPIPLRTPRY